MTPNPVRKFSTGASSHRKRQMSLIVEKEGQLGASLTTLYLGISAVFADDHTAVVALAIHDTTYLLDFSVKHVALDEDLREGNDLIADHIISEVENYEHENFVKFIGAGLPTSLKYMSPTLCSRLWLELDIIPVVLRPDSEAKEKSFWDVKRVDEQADSMVRKCILNFGPSLVPLLQVGWRGIVQTDAGFRVHLTTVGDHKATCGLPTWNTMQVYANRLREKKTKVAFFSSTPQGGGVALMRHALVRLSRLLGVDLVWYVPKPRPGVFRITKNVHNILQGVSHPDQRISAEEKASITDWIEDNANRYWLSEGGPLRPPEEGGADVIIIDDPQMPGLIPLIKKITPNRPVLYRSHIQIRSDLVAIEGSPQADIWSFLWGNIQHADMFISHPIPKFVPLNVPREKVVYLPATTDWLDGLNKPMNKWDTGYYGHIYNQQCHSQRMTPLAWPNRKYIAQVARFDPAKGIPTVIDSYAEFRRQCDKAGITDVPQLVVCGNGSIDDPDATIIFDQTMNQLETHYPELLPDCSVIRLEPNDQLLNMVIANAHVILQLSTPSECKYIAQVARFDPAKGIPTVIDSYAEFRRQCDKAGITDVPQLVVCGNGSIDDPDATIIFDQTMNQLETHYPELLPDCSVIRLEPNDQLLNMVIANAHVILQLSTREGFEIKVSEALHAGVPVICSNEGGIPTQVKENVNGYLVTPGDYKTVAGHLMKLFTDEELHAKMSYEARTGVSDEVGTVGNALGWFYLAAKFAENGVNPGLPGNEKWVNDMARDEAKIPYTEGENRLPRRYTQKAPEAPAEEDEEEEDDE